MATETPHKYIEILEYCYEHETFTRRQIAEHFNLTDLEVKQYVIDFVSRDISCDLGVNDPECVFRMRTESFLNYLDYIELKEARASSKSAKSLAIKAMAISAFLALGSIGLTIYQMNTAEPPVGRYVLTKAEHWNNSIWVLDTATGEVSTYLQINRNYDDDKTGQGRIIKRPYQGHVEKP